MKLPRWTVWIVIVLVGIGLFCAGWYVGHSNGSENHAEAFAGSLNIASEPPGAKVYLDGEYTGKITPCFMSRVDTGTHTLKLTLEHYQQRVDEITVHTGEITYIEWTLGRAIEHTRVIQPGPGKGKDSYVFEYNSVGNYGSAMNLVVGASLAGEYYRSYLQFDTSTIPATAVVTDAKLALYYIETSSEVATQIGIYRVIDSWDEDDINWISQPLYSTTPESTTSIPAKVTWKFVYWDIRDLVQGWVDGSKSNRGVLLMDTDDTTVTAWKNFYSSSSPVLAQAPKLEVTYYDPNP